MRRFDGWCDVRGIAFDAEQEQRADQQPLQRPLDARVESSLGAPVIVEWPQYREVRLGYGPSIGAPRNTMRPMLDRIRPTIKLSNVDLPHPDGPINAVTFRS